MCQMINMNIGGNTIRVADIKSKYMHIIASLAAQCDYIDKIVLFGSSISESCTDESDIDIAVFGNQPKGKCLTSTKFLKFTDDLAAYDGYKQIYDILYFKSGSKNNSPILKEIDKGEVLYAR